MKVCTVDQMKHMERTAIEECGVDETSLMENAGIAAATLIKREIGICGLKFIVLCGSGSKCGVGLVTARQIHSFGGQVKVLLLGRGSESEKAYRKNLKSLSKMKVEISSPGSIDAIERAILQSDAIVDALFGPEIRGEVTGFPKQAIELINRSRKPVISLEIPSGINGDNGLVLGSAINADYTISFGLPKVGSVLYPGYEHCGKLFVSHLSYPPSLYDHASMKVEINVPLELPKRKQDAHKGTFGDVLFIAGARGYYGAPYFASLSFLKAGGGYSRLAAPSTICPFIGNKGSEIVIIPQGETPQGSISYSNCDDLLTLAQNMDMVVIGPGLSLVEETQDLVRYLAENIDRPLLIDGDGITAVSKDLDCIRRRKAQTIITPHPGEMSRVTGDPVGELRSDRIGILCEATKDLNSIIVLKEGISLIGYPDESVFVNLSGNSGMSTAGSGDVLTGTIAAMQGLGLSIDESVRTGVFIHGLSGDLAAIQIGQDGMTAQDVLDFLPAALRYYRQNYASIRECLYNKISVL